MQKITGLIVSSTKYRDFDAIINVLSETGLVPILIRGAYRKNNKNICFVNPSIYAEFEVYQGKTNGFKLRTGNIICSYLYYCNNFEKLSCLNTILELLSKSTLDVDAAKLLSFTLDSLNEIKITNKEINGTTYFILNLMKILGIGMNFEFCIRCSSKNDLTHVSINDGSVICSKCATNNDFFVGPEIVKWAKSLIVNYDADLNTINYVDKLNFVILLLTFIEDSFNIKLNSKRFFNTLIIG